MPLTRIKDRALLQTGAYINGQWLENGRRFTVTDPGTGHAIAEVCNAGAAETLQAISAAETAFSSWRKETARNRSTILRRWFDLIQTHREDLATLGPLASNATCGRIDFCQDRLPLWFGRRDEGRPQQTNRKRSGNNRNDTSHI